MSDDEELKRRVNNLERQREEDRQMILDLREDIQEVTAALRESNVYYKESYKRIEKGEAHREKQDAAMDTLAKTIIKNQPAVDSVNRIKAGLIGVVFAVLASVTGNWLIAVNAPPVNKTEKELILKQLERLERLERLEAHQHEE